MTMTPPDTSGIPGIAKSPTGIAGFDAITRGGIPTGRATVVAGGPGSGKTIFALQSLVHGASKMGEPGILVTFEESPDRIVANAATFGWDLPRLQEKDLFFLDAQLSPQVATSGDFDLHGVLAAVGAKAEAMGARRVVFDGIDVLLSVLNNPAAERRELHRLHEWLVETGLTAIITSKVEPGDSPSAERYGFLQFMTDCVVLIEHKFTGRVSVRGIRTVKYRGSNFSANEYPLTITSRGIGVATYGSAELSHPVSTERVSSGVPGLDSLLGGGYFRGTSVLVTGAPGVAKTTLSGSFAEAACARGERTLFVSFDEAADQIQRNLESVGIRLGPHRESGALRLYSVRAESRSSEEHLFELQCLLQEHAPTNLIVDPISALAKAGGQLAAVDASLRLLDYAKSLGMTTLCTSLIGSGGPIEEASAMEISTIADTWIQLSYSVRGGERNRAITIIKSRGMAHSNQVRELVLRSDGVFLVDVFTAGGEVLMGTARLEKEMELDTEQALRAAEVERRRRELERAEAQIQLQINGLQQELETRRSELGLLSSNRDAVERSASVMRDRVRSQRGGKPSDQGGQDRETDES